MIPQDLMKQALNSLKVLRIHENGESTRKKFFHLNDRTEEIRL